jgi:hypothetical protein
MKSLGDHEMRKSARVRRCARVKEGCQVSRSQNIKSLEDWQNTRVKNTALTALFPPARGGEREKGKRDSSLRCMVIFREEFNNLSDDSSFSQLHP